MASVPESSLAAGRFGRMFRNLPSYAPDATWLEDLAGTMVEGAGSGDGPLPAGITYFGQFVDHDLTFDPVSSLDRQNDPDALQNFRTPRFDLDSVYGRGPDDQPYLYDKDDPAKLLIAFGEPSPPPPEDPQPNLNDPHQGLRREHDLPRNTDERALIGDPRNDENVIVSQLQLAFLKLHNQIVDDIRDPNSALQPHLWSIDDPFREAQRLARWHYQWLVLKAFLPAICDPAVITELVEETPAGAGKTCRRVKSLRYYVPRSGTAYIPVEWSVAAYRFGHSLIRPSYHLNATLRGFRPDAAPIDIFIENPTPDNRLQHLAGGRALPPFWTIDWRMFFESGEGDLQRVRRIDTKLASGLSHLPGAEDGMRALARRNLLRGRAMGLPSGEAIARRICAPPIAPADELEGKEAPLWFYVLSEADQQADGARLGRVGSTIVAETMLGMLADDPFSFLRTDPNWEPVLPPRVAGTAPSEWSFVDMLSYAVPADGRHLQPPGPEPPPAPAPGGW